MVLVNGGTVDVGDEGFVVEFDYALDIVERMKTIQRRRFDRDRLRWVVDRHWPSVHQLFHIALDYGFHLSASARAEEERLRRENCDLEYTVDAVHDHVGAMWFVCKTGDDDDLRRKVRDIEGAYWDDSWWVPTDWETCCRPLREIVDHDERFVVSNAASRLLYEEDVSEWYVRSEVRAPEPVVQEHPVQLQLVEPRASEPPGSVRKPRVTSQRGHVHGEPGAGKKQSG